MTAVKICGITNLEDAQLACDLGATALGFNFWRRSSRYVAPEKVSVITKLLSGRNVLFVGVFVNEDTDAIRSVAQVTGLDWIQLHGDEASEIVLSLKQSTRLPVMKAFRVSPAFDPEGFDNYNADAVLLDAFSPVARGGTGHTFDWSVARQVRDLHPNLYLAGGLTPQNIVHAIASVKPFGVDICSGVESSPGKKDPEKMGALFSAINSTK